MKRSETELHGVKSIHPQVFGDHRGYFMETYNIQSFHEMGIETVFIQDNQSFTAKKGTVRGIHFQNPPMAQTKLVRVTHGAVMDIAVDLRQGSPTYLKWQAVELTADNKLRLYIPRGFGRGCKTLTNDVEFCYKLYRRYSKEHDCGIRFDDPIIGIDWGEAVREELLSQKDMKAPLLYDSDCKFVYEETQLYDIDSK